MLDNDNDEDDDHNDDHNYNYNYEENDHDHGMSSDARILLSNGENEAVEIPSVVQDFDVSVVTSLVNATKMHRLEWFWLGKHSSHPPSR